MKITKIEEKVSVFPSDYSRSDIFDEQNEVNSPIIEPLLSKHMELLY